MASIASPMDAYGAWVLTTMSLPAPGSASTGGGVHPRDTSQAAVFSPTVNSTSLDTLTSSDASAIGDLLLCVRDDRDVAALVPLAVVDHSAGGQHHGIGVATAGAVHLADDQPLVLVGVQERHSLSDALPVGRVPVDRVLVHLLSPLLALPTTAPCWPDATRVGVEPARRARTQPVVHLIGFDPGAFFSVPFLAGHRMVCCARPASIAAPCISAAFRVVYTVPVVPHL